jgi:hypothetical protein
MPGEKMIPPKNLRLVDGELVMDDGSDVREYLRQWAKRVGADENTPVNLLRHEDLMRSYWGSMDERFALAS